MLDDEAPQSSVCSKCCIPHLPLCFSRASTNYFNFYWKNVDDFYVVQNRFIYGFSIPMFRSSLIQEFFTLKNVIHAQFIFQIKDSSNLNSTIASSANCKLKARKLPINKQENSNLVDHSQHHY